MKKALLTALLCAVSLAVSLSGCGEQSAAVVKAPRFNDSTPPAGAQYAAQPINVTLNFSVDVEAEGSSLSVEGSDGKEWARGPVVIEDQNTAMKRELAPGMPDGMYTVSYTAALASGTSGDGRFSFSIDTDLQSDYEDLRGEDAVTISMNHLAFEPKDAIVSPGTTITWTNQEGAPHFVNTETHPEHTYYPPMNSTELAQGQTFSVKLETPGQYDYHCSLHYPQKMVGSIIVAE